MVLANILTIVLITSAVLLIAGFYFKKRALLMSLSAGLILTITGIMLLNSGLSYPTGTIITEVNATTTSTQEIYTGINDGLIQMLGWVILITGFASFIGSAIGLNKLRYDNDELEDDFDYKYNF